MASNNTGLVLPAQPGTPGEIQDIRPLKGPVEIPGGYEWLWWLLAAALAAAIAWYLWRKFRLKKPAPKPAIVIPPHRKAKDRLRGAAALMSRPYEFCSLLSDVLRSYVEERFNLHAPDRTTEEFMDELRTSTEL